MQFSYALVFKIDTAPYTNRIKKKHLSELKNKKITDYLKDVKANVLANRNGGCRYGKTKAGIKEDVANTVSSLSRTRSNSKQDKYNAPNNVNP